MTSPRSQLAADLRAAAEYVRRGWCQRRRACNSRYAVVDPCDPDAERWCVIGALHAAMGDGLTGTRFDVAANAIQAETGRWLSGWNDAPERTQQDVIAALEAAAGKAERQP